MIFPITNWAVPIYEYLKGINKIVLLFICAELTKIVGFLPPISSTIIYGIIIIYAIHCLLHTKNYESIYLGLLSYIPLQILITSPNVMFSPWQRYLLFAIIIITCSGMCQSEILRSERGRIFEIICFSCAIIGVGSFFCTFSGHKLYAGKRYYRFIKSWNIRRISFPFYVVGTNCRGRLIIYCQ